MLDKFNFIETTKKKVVTELETQKNLKSMKIGMLGTFKICNCSQIWRMMYSVPTLWCKMWCTMRQCSRKYKYFSLNV